MKWQMIVSIMAAWLWITPLLADTHYVVQPGTESGTPTSPFTNWATAATDLVMVVRIAEVVSDDTVLVSNGTYYLTNKIYCAAKAITLRSVNGRDVTIINGGAPTYTNIAVFINHTNAVVDGFTITNCWAPASGYNDGGGVLLWEPGTVRNCTIVNNRARYSGGVSPRVGGTVSNCIIRGNVASESGGGIYGPGSVYDCQIIGNYAKAIGGMYSTAYRCLIAGNAATNGSGGGIAYGTAYDCVISNNTATSSGGGMNGVSAFGCTIVSNTAVASGGGFYMNAGNLVSNCVIYGNVAADGGGAYISGAGTVLLCQIIGNVATSTTSSTCGGGVYAGSLAVVRSCLIASNSSWRFGGGATLSGALLENCTLAANSATNSGGGGGIYAKSAARLANCIIYYNTSVGTYTNYRAEGSSTFTNCCATPTNNATFLGSGNIEGPPLFVNTNAGDYRLSSGSPCINTGLNGDWMTNAVDLDGRQRLRYERVDMGAYEHIYKGTIFSFR